MPCAMQKGAFHASVMPQPNVMVPSTTHGMYGSGKMFRMTSSRIQPIIRASRYHMGPQEKKVWPKYSAVWGSPSAKPPNTFRVS